MVDFRLVHDGTDWIADDGQVSVRAQTLPALDLALAALLRKNRSRYPGPTLDVRMTFDHSVIPQWMRQYSNHYFNRVVTLSLTD